MKAMKHLHALAAAAAIGLASAGLHAHSPSDAQALADLWTHAFNSRDVGAVAALYRDDAELSQHNALTLVGRPVVWESCAPGTLSAVQARNDV